MDNLFGNPTNTRPHRLPVIWLLLLTAYFGQCTRYDVPPPPQPSPFSATLEGNKTTFPAAGGTANILVSAGANGWWIVVPEDKKSWLAITRVYGAGNFSVPVTVRANTTKAVRTVEVIVNSSYQMPPVRLEISQEG